jgi:hypothetical protein
MENIMHILQIKYDKIVCRNDPISYSYIITKYWDLIRKTTVSATLNSFKFQFFAHNTEEVCPDQPFINLDGFLEIIKDDARDDFSRIFRPGRESLGQLLKLFILPNVDGPEIWVKHKIS